MTFQTIPNFDINFLIAVTLASESALNKLTSVPVLYHIFVFVTLTVQKYLLVHNFSSALTLERMISGARYSGVPHNVHVRPLTLLANPKSVTCKFFQGLSLQHFEINTLHNCIVKVYLDYQTVHCSWCNFSVWMAGEISSLLEAKIMTVWADSLSVRIVNHLVIMVIKNTSPCIWGHYSIA